LDIGPNRSVRTAFGTRSCPSLAVSPGASTGEPSSSYVPTTRARASTPWTRY